MESNGNAHVRIRDSHYAQSSAEIIELRKQATRRKITYILVGMYGACVGYLVVYGDPNVQGIALGSLSSIVAAVVGFYFAGKANDA